MYIIDLFKSIFCIRCYKNMLKKTIHVVAAAMYNDKNKVFCALRSQKMSLPGLWEFPGGKIEINETPEEALTREIQEELGCRILIQTHIHTHLHEYENINVNLSVYKAIIQSGIIQLHEHEKGVWLPIPELLNLNWAPADIPAIKKILNEENKDA